MFPHALELSIDLLRCPTCRARGLNPGRGALRCPAGHTFNIGRHGYVSLLADTRATSGDDPAMVQARNRFLAGGHYSPIREAVARLASGATVVDVGCGPGYYLAGVLDQLPGARGLGLDTSVRAVRSAARAHSRAAAATWDVFRPFPLADAVADVVLNVFAPRNPAEFHRVIRRGGRLIVVRPTERHLAELPAAIGVDPAKEERLHRALGRYFDADVTEEVTYSMSLTGQDVRELVGMTPNARHVDPAALDTAPGRQVTASVLATAYRAK